MTLTWIILFSILGSIGAITAAAGFILLSERRQKSIISILIAFATGTLLTAAFYSLIPEAIHLTGHQSHNVMLVVIGGILFFFLLEKIIIWRNCSEPSCDIHGEAAGPIVLIGDALHNFTDGIVIAAAFLTNIMVGIAVGFAIIAHEIPQETGDFGILIHSGMSKKKSYVANAISSATTIPSAILSYFILGNIQIFVPYVLAISAASFIYIALSDLTPELHQKLGIKHTIRQLVLIILGVLTLLLIFNLGGHGH
ncbi:MAG: ZIP family metal transporter [Candidatus Lokiarchaeota archaeon]|nr:ZIP family metal transporter [Candidatus Lokiarchaeota archaeon]MBD3343170.1 ZIP family metal transporter [Candidatus Lokiarchaeota archaeon]